jgi:hypothetical protein
MGAVVLLRCYGSAREALLAKGKNWSDWFGWWMDVAKSLLTAVLGFGLAYFLLDNLQQQRNEERAVCSTAVARMDRALQTFEQAAINYRDATNNAFIELYRWRDEQPSEPIRRFWGPAHSDLRAALETVRRRFPIQKGVEDGIQETEQAMQEAYALLDPLYDRRLDRIEKAYAQIRNERNVGKELDSAYAAAILPLTRSEIDMHRSDHENNLGNLDRARGTVVQNAEKMLAVPASTLCRVRT